MPFRVTFIFYTIKEATYLSKMYSRHFSTTNKGNVSRTELNDFRSFLGCQDVERPNYLTPLPVTHQVNLKLNTENAFLMVFHCPNSVWSDVFGIYVGNMLL